MTDMHEARKRQIVAIFVVGTLILGFKRKQVNSSLIFMCIKIPQFVYSLKLFFFLLLLVQRGIYKDIVLILQNDRTLTEGELRSKVSSSSFITSKYDCNFKANQICISKIFFQIE